ncbi:MAG: SRPBCC family protein [Solirubrobacterales bacterium]
MHVHELDTTQRLPLSPAELFPFFAEARNLERITPPWLQFTVLTPAPVEMRRGALIHYRLRLHMIPVGWVTQIEAWEPDRLFIDRQLLGPYSLWHHEHHFEPDGGGTVMRDRVRYVLPAGPAGEVAHTLFVRNDIEKIFAFRHRAVEQMVAHGDLGSG